MEHVGTGRYGRSAPSWTLLAGAGLAMLGAVGVTAAVLVYRRTGLIFYPSLAVVNYSLRGIPLQPPALVVSALSLVALWLTTRRRSHRWALVAALGLAVSVTILVVAASPYRPVARAVTGTSMYQLASYHPDDRIPELFVLFTCDRTGIICRQVSAYAPFDVASGYHVAGTPDLVIDPATRAVALHINGHVIGIYVPTAPAKSSRRRMTC